jgi:hypothetical protein
MDMYYWLVSFHEFTISYYNIARVCSTVYNQVFVPCKT